MFVVAMVISFAGQLMRCYINVIIKMFRGCGEQPHEPCNCEHWEQWREKIKQSVPQLSPGILLTVILEYYSICCWLCIDCYIRVIC